MFTVRVLAHVVLCRRNTRSSALQQFKLILKTTKTYLLKKFRDVSTTELVSSKKTTAVAKTPLNFVSKYCGCFKD